MTLEENQCLTRGETAAVAQEPLDERTAMITYSQQSKTSDSRRLRFMLTAITTSASVIATFSFGISGVSATESQEGTRVSAEAITKAIVRSGAELVANPTLTSAIQKNFPVQTSEISVNNGDLLSVLLPASLTEGVKLSVPDFELRVDLPNASEAGPAELLPNGMVGYPSSGPSANALVPLERGVQMLSVISDRSAPEAYDYRLSFPEGYQLETTPDGAALIVDLVGTEKVVFEPAWAWDANGQSIPTHYSVSGDTLTQVVEHQNLDSVAYPVVADPLPVIVIVVTAAAAIAVAAATLGVATWIVVSWWNTCRAQNMYPELSTRNGFTARCVR